MSDSQAITSVDIKLMASERMHDEDDGGGRMSGNEIIDGQSNNMFPDVSELDRTYGRINLRKTFPAIMSHDTDTYYGAHIMVAEPPTDEAVHVSLLQTSTSNKAWTDERLDAQNKIESYVTIGPLSPYRLVGDCWEGQRAINVYYKIDAVKPTIGKILILIDPANEIREYIRIMRVTEKKVTYNEEGHSFDRMQATLDISDALNNSFLSGRITDDDSYTPPTLVHNSNNIPSVAYYGIQRLADPISFGDRALRVVDYKGHLLPASQSEEALTDLKAGFNNPFVVSAGIRDVTMSPILNTSVIAILDNSMIRYNYTGMALNPKPHPFTFKAAYRSKGQWYSIQDEYGTGQLTGDGSGAVDYSTGSWSISLKDYPDINSRIVIGWGSFQEVIKSDSATIDIPKYVYTLSSVPVKAGSVVITWTVDGVARTMTDDSKGFFTGDGYGYIIYGTGYTNIHLGSLPDPSTYINITYDKLDIRVEEFKDVERSLADDTWTVVLEEEPIFSSMHIEAGYFLESAWTLVTFTYWTLYEYQGGAYWIPHEGSFITKQYYAAEDGYKQRGISGESYAIDYAGRKRWVRPHTLESTVNDEGKFGFGNVDQTNKTVVIESTYGKKYDYRTTDYDPKENTDSNNWERSYRWNNTAKQERWFNDEVTIKVTYCPIGGSETNITEQIEVHKLQIDLTPSRVKAIVPNSVAFTLGTSLFFDNEGVMYRDPDENWVGTECGMINYESGEVILDWWPAGNPDIDVRSMLVIDNPYLANAIDSYVPIAPIRPQSFQIAATTAAGALITGYADANGYIIGDFMYGYIDITSGTFSVQFGERVLADDMTDEEKEQDWYNEKYVDDEGYFIKPEPVYPETIRYNCVSYVYMPLSEDILGLSTVRLPFDGKVPIYRVGDIIVVHHTKKTVIDTPTDGQVVDLGRVRLSWVKIYDDNGNKVDTSLYTPDLDAGTVTLDNMSGVVAPITIYDRIEDMALINELRIDGTLGVTKAFSHDFPSDAYASSALILKDLFAHISNVFEQKTWTGEWSDELIGDQPIARYNDTLYPIEISNDGATQERWALIFTSTTSFKVVGEFSGQIAVGDVNSDCSPTNPATGRPYFTVRAPGWGSGWVHDNVLRFNTIAANKPVWVARTILQSEEATGSDKFCIEIRGDVNTD